MRRAGPLNLRFARHQEPVAPELELMQQIVQYNVEINCGPCPEGYASRIARQLQTAFRVTSCQSTRTGLAMRIISGYRFADGALKDFADMVGETLTGLGIAMTMGVVRMVTRQGSYHTGVLQRAQDLAATLTGIDWRPVREVPVFYFYKGLRFDLDLSARLKALNQMEQVGAF
jgi:hypothetical protein